MELRKNSFIQNFPLLSFFSSSSGFHFLHEWCCLCHFVVMPDKNNNFHFPVLYISILYTYSIFFFEEKWEFLRFSFLYTPYTACHTLVGTFTVRKNILFALYVVETEPNEQRIETVSSPFRLWHIWSFVVLFISVFYFLHLLIFSFIHTILF